MCSLESSSRTYGGCDKEGEEESLPTTGGGGGASTRLDCRRVREEELDLHSADVVAAAFFLCVFETVSSPHASSSFNFLSLIAVEDSTYGATSLKKSPLKNEDVKVLEFSKVVIK